MQFDLLTFLGQTISSGLLASAALMLFEPKKLRITEHNAAIKDIEAKIDQAHLLATRYWLTSSEEELAQNILAIKTDCYRMVTSIRINCRDKSTSRCVKQYFEEITGRDFNSTQRVPNPQTITTALVLFSNFKNALDKEKLKVNLRTLFFIKIH